MNSDEFLRQLEAEIEALKVQYKELQEQLQSVEQDILAHERVYQRARKKSAGASVLEPEVISYPDRGSRIFALLKQTPNGEWDTRKLLRELSQHDEALANLMLKDMRGAQHAVATAIRYYNQQHGNPIKVTRRGRRNFYSVKLELTESNPGA